MSELLATRGVSTFGDLRVAAADGVPSYAAEVLVSDLTAGRSLVLPREAARLGLEPDALDVALAVRASMSLPVFFQPVRVRNPATQDDHILVDGAVLSRFPVSLFDDRDSPSTSPTLGILVDDKQDEDEEPSSPDEPPVHGGPLTLKYLRRLVAARAERPPLSGPDSARTIIVPSLGLRATNFDAAAEQLHALYHGGRDAARMFLDRSEPVDGDSPPL